MAHVALVRGEDFEAIRVWMEQRCAELGTVFERHTDRLVYEPQP